MKKLFFLLILSVGALSAQGFDDVASFGSLGTESPDPLKQKILVNNRVLINLQGKAITVLDVQKKLDYLFHREYPQFEKNTQARFEFYKQSWKFIVQDFVEKQLVLLDAEKNNLPVSQGDIRQEMNSIFGNNIIASLDKIGMSFTEASAMIKEDITVRRMMMGKVNMKAAKTVTPKLIKEAYDSNLIEVKRPGQWTYQVLSIKGRDASKCREIAQSAHSLLTKEHLSPAEINKELHKKGLGDYSVTVSCSELFTHKEKDLSGAYREILSKLTPASYSEPLAQKSRSEGHLYRIFYLKELEAPGIRSYTEMEDEIRLTLLNREMKKETQEYFMKLRKEFNLPDNYLDELVPADFFPFRLV